MNAHADLIPFPSTDDTSEAAPWDADIRTFDCRHAFYPSLAATMLRCFHGIETLADLPPLAPRDPSEIAWLRRMATDPHGGLRPPIRVAADQIAELTRLGEEMPNFAPAIDLISARAMASHRTQFPLEMPPILLLGPIGIGKTRFALRLADALGTCADILDISVNHLVDPFGGMPREQGGRDIGLVARALIESPNDAPLILVDGIDRYEGRAAAERAFDQLHTYLTECAEGGRIDAYVDVPIMAGRVIWVATAESLETVPPALTALFQIIAIEPPTPSEMCAVIRTIAVETNCRLRAESLDRPIDDEALGLFGAVTPRHARRLIENATAAAVATGRGTLTALDIEQELRREG